MPTKLALTEAECRTIHQLSKQRVEDLTHILVHHLETERYREDAREELQRLILLQQKLDVFLQDVENMRG